MHQNNFWAKWLHSGPAVCAGLHDFKTKKNLYAIESLSYCLYSRFLRLVVLPILSNCWSLSSFCLTLYPCQSKVQTENSIWITTENHFIYECYKRISNLMTFVFHEIVCIMCLPHFFAKSVGSMKSGYNAKWKRHGIGFVIIGVFHVFHVFHVNRIC